MTLSRTCHSNCHTGTTCARAAPHSAFLHSPPAPLHGLDLEPLQLRSHVPAGMQIWEENLHTKVVQLIQAQIRPYPSTNTPTRSPEGGREPSGVIAGHIVELLGQVLQVAQERLAHLALQFRATMEQTSSQTATNSLLAKPFRRPRTAHPSRPRVQHSSLYPLPTHAQQAAPLALSGSPPPPAEQVSLLQLAAAPARCRR